MSSREELRKMVERNLEEIEKEALKITDDCEDLVGLNAKQENKTVDEGMILMFKAHSLYDGGCLFHVQVSSSQLPRPIWYSALVFIVETTKEWGISAMKECVQMLPGQVHSIDKPYISPLSTDYLKRNYIVTNTTTARRFDHFALYCQLCETHIKNLFEVLSHKRQPEHDLQAQRLHQRGRMVDAWKLQSPKLTVNYRDCLDKIHKRVSQNIRRFYRMTEVANLQDTMDAFGSLQRDYAVRFFPLGGFSNWLITRDTKMHDCPVVVDFYVQINTTDGSPVGSEERMRVFENLLPSTVFVEREEHLNGLICLVKVHETESIQLFITIDPKAEKLLLTARLFSLYTRCSPAYLQLAQLLRYWAHWMGLQKSFNEDGVSGSIFDYMALFFMQRHEFVPILNEETVGSSLEEFLEKSDDEQMEIAKSIFDDHKVPDWALTLPRLWMNLILFYGCAFNRQEMIQITSKKPVMKENGGRRHIRILDPLLNINIFQIRMENYAHLENCFFLGAADFLALKSNNGLHEKLRTTSYALQTNRFQRTIGYVFVLYDTKGRRPRMGDDHCTVHIQFSNGVNSWNSCLLKRTPLLCTWCRKGPHLCRDCPLLLRKQMSKDDELAPGLEDELTIMSSQWFEDEHLTDDEFNSAQAFIDSFAQKFNTTTNHNFEFLSFGSLASGLGAKGCDLDVCVHIPNEKLDEDRQRDLLSSIFDYCNSDGSFVQVRHVSRAKVPIINFIYELDGVHYHGDFSCSNLLALHNTQLLKTYTMMDSRVSPFVLAIKKWFNVMGLNDASSGTLSSYAITIMAIHFLQHTETPVLTCLQDSNHYTLPEEQLVEEWDVRFGQLHDRIIAEPLEPNGSSLGRLFVQFFDYFDGFDWKNEVVQIRQCSSRLLKMDKDWARSAMAIEDPFELSHNLSAGVRNHKSMYILKCFNAMRQEFRSPECRILNENFGFKSFAEIAPKKPDALVPRERRAPPPVVAPTNESTA